VRDRQRREHRRKGEGVTDGHRHVERDHAGTGRAISCGREDQPGDSPLNEGEYKDEKDIEGKIVHCYSLLSHADHAAMTIASAEQAAVSARKTCGPSDTAVHPAVC